MISLGQNVQIKFAFFVLVRVNSWIAYFGSNRLSTKSHELTRTRSIRVLLICCLSGMSLAIPSATAQTLYRVTIDQGVRVKMRDKNHLEAAKDELNGAMRRVRELQPEQKDDFSINCLLYTSPSPRDRQKSRMPSSA